MIAQELCEACDLEGTTYFHTRGGRPGVLGQVLGARMEDMLHDNDGVVDLSLAERLQ